MKIFFYDKVAKALSKIPLLKLSYRATIKRKYIKLECKISEDLKKNENVSLEKQSEDLDERILKLLKSVNEYNIYYQNLFRKINILINDLVDFKKIPFLTKELIKANLDDLISKNADKIFLRKSNSGGSTGEPLEFFSDHYTDAVDNAHHLYLYNLMGYKQGDLIADSGGIKIDKQLRDKNIYWIKYPKGVIWGHWGFSALYLKKDNIQFYIDKIVELKPAIFRGYASFFNSLALYILEKKINLNFSVKGMNLTAEYCSGDQRKNIEEAFKTKVFLEYGQGEKTVFCYTDGSSYEYRSSPMYGYVEVINDNGEDALPGEEGEIIATSINNYAQPFIRYKTSDRAKVSWRKGGIVKFEKILGRTQDYILDKNNNKHYLTALIFGQHFRAFKSIKHWQIIQEMPGSIEINIVKGDDYTNSDEKEIENKIQSIAEIDIKFNYTENISLTRSGKKLFLIQKCKQV